jgi:hypothetical protein
MSFQSIAHSIGRRWFLRRMHNKPVLIDLPAQLNKINRILVLMPEDETEYRRMNSKRLQVKTLFPKAEWIFLKPKSFSGREASDLEWDGTDLDYWGLPGREIKKRLLAKPFDLILDMGLLGCFFNLTVAQLVPAPVKICIAHPQREDEVFNFVLSFTAPPSWEQAFASLRQYLAV